MRFSQVRDSSLLVAVLLVATGCGTMAPPSNISPGAVGTVSVVASTNVWGDVAAQIGGQHVTVVSLISDPEADPHSHEASAQSQLALSKAAIVIENGGGYDDFVDTMLDARGGTRPVVINTVEVSGKTATGSDQLNEHVWYDFPTVAKVAAELVARLSTADPAAAADYAANGEKFKTSLAGLVAQEAAIKTAHAGVGVAITETVPVYLLEAAGLINKTPGEFSAAVEEGTDASASVLQKTLALFSDRQVQLLVYNEQTAGPQTEQLIDAARQNEIAVVPVTETLPSGKDYLTWMDATLKAIAVALQ